MPDSRKKFHCTFIGQSLNIYIYICHRDSKLKPFRNIKSQLTQKEERNEYSVYKIDEHSETMKDLQKKQTHAPLEKTNSLKKKANRKKKSPYTIGYETADESLMKHQNIQG